MVSAVLFVCLGNICRSPLAEAALRAEAEVRGLDLIVDSAGTADWHKGKAPDPRSQAVALRHGIDISGYRGRQVTAADFRRFSHIVALDANNMADLRRIAPDDATARVSLLLDFVAGREGQAVADPYYGDDAGFDLTWADVIAGARGIADAAQASG
ncbi:low molecular weight protein-tyrosine-phosphatase [Sphingomonas flavalba]|uniref:low molecular weight protein-tyrosine-phosphatase n=1 Tax=Sphingomonas flavalba TaxID=2559804 RepID=UPI0039E029B5